MLSLPARRGLRVSSFACLLLGSTAVFAADDGWHVTVGAGGLDMPRYPGSADRRSRLVPVLNASYGRFFLGGVPGSGSPAGLGMYFHQDTQWRAGISFAYDFVQPRKESDDRRRLHGMGDIDRTARATLFGSYTADWLTVRGSVSSDIGGKDQGTTASLDAEGRYRWNERLSFVAGPGVAWADGRHNRTFYGVDALQSLRSGYAAYRPGSGLESIRFSLGADYRFNPHWSAGVRAIAARLQGDAADSPLVEKRMQNTYVAYAAYRF
ncbi:MipA/OmpV family protein [Dyella sp. BiH032]|uniref:MipA/OmpV family protein n=1 Tax=Dyella sp. BiH032 TaxID=3075430 RepID=UPI0028934910|nr:MipA/OmpV family protein [Dyella sp. BiH032]WNL44629.1 MipA/OmpV family protein [Dyella sp. BiH032]